MGQLKAGDTRALRAGVADGGAPASCGAGARRSTTLRAGSRVRARCRRRPRRSRDPRAPRRGRGRRPAVVIRQDGDANLLVEYGPPVLDLGAALPGPRADAGAARRARCPGVVDVTPGIRSLQIHYDDRRLPRERLLAVLRERRGGAAGDRTTSRCRRASCTCRCRGTIRRRGSRSEKYMQSVRPDAPWCPSNIEFIRRINGLDIDRRRAAHRLRRELPGARPRRRLPGRARGDAARSAPPPGHHQVQPRAHLDARERGRHRRRLPVRLRHGRPGRLSVRGPHLPGVEPLPRDRASSRGGTPWLLRFFDQIRFYPGRRAGAARVPRRVPARAGAA